eukprot:CAMPEP_0172490642 /NCGR_PEP_ID=MMETSP1066-20121228/21148_1 /TAXON_ID=671091 /ORGANISM="Coscinodiscus wailesii, Strain CCMP2513" /LENGTH=162 /DNA_ID=CAMNT_0013259215 /DNA_START=126 /DNA_END=614 /DNA_ORIENTATION=+
MKLFAIIFGVNAILEASAFTSPINVAVMNRMSSSSESSCALSMNTNGSGEDSVSSRRQALGHISGWAAAAATIASAPTIVYADDADDTVKRIAAQSAAANEAARAKKEKEAAAKAEGGGTNLVGLAAAGGVVLTLPFFLPNLQRLGTKLGSGGESDGYGKKK